MGRNIDQGRWCEHLGVLKGSSGSDTCNTSTERYNDQNFELPWRAANETLGV